MHIALAERMVELVTAGFSLVAALAWNNVIGEVVNEYIKPYLPKGSGLISLVIYAVAITAFAVFITTHLTKFISKLSGPSSEE